MMGGSDNSPRRRRPKSTLTVPSGTEEPSTPSREKRQRKRRRKDPPFWLLVVQVGSTLAMICLLGYVAYRLLLAGPSAPPATAEDYDDMYDDTVNAQEVIDQPEQQQQAVAAGEEDILDIVQEATYPPLPTWNLTTQSQFDAFAFAKHYRTSKSNQEENEEEDTFWIAAAGLRQQFQDLYGGENAARALLERGTFVVNDQEAAQTTACRMRHAKTTQRPFRMAFGGYSVTAGRGNYFRQSFPLVLEQKLHTLFYLLHMELVVTNAAIGGCPSFPYGWCMPQFWGPEPDVVSWDFSMNEAGGDPRGLEAYIRHVLQLQRQQRRKPPKLIVKDTHMADERRDVLRDYQTWLPDAVVIHTEPAARPFLDRPEQHRPEGFQEWRKFGAPPGAPGQALHHPAVKEHAFIAWILIMHFLSALELVAADRDGTFSLQCPPDKDENESFVALPPPRVVQAASKEANLEEEATPDLTLPPWNSILFGQPIDEKNLSSAWRMNPVHCRTSFEPIIPHSGELSSVIVSGSVAEELDVMLPKSKMYYNSGWVLDLSEGEKKAKRNLDRFDGLGFRDSKKAYYALPTSHTLRLLLPLELPSFNHNTTNTPSVGDAATDYVRSVVWCEVNEKRDSPSACRTDQDVTFVVGGVAMSSNTTANKPVPIDAGGTVFLGKKVCLYLRVPEGARLTNRATMRSEDSHTKRKVYVTVDGRNETTSPLENSVGLAVEATVINPHIIKREDACSVSHVVWEQVLEHPAQTDPKQ